MMITNYNVNESHMYLKIKWDYKAMKWSSIFKVLKKEKEKELLYGILKGFSMVFFGKNIF